MHTFSFVMFNKDFFNLFSHLTLYCIYAFLYPISYYLLFLELFTCYLVHFDDQFYIHVPL